MTYIFPPSLDALRMFLKSKGFEGSSVKTPRQAAFVAQQLLGTRVKFPPQGADMLPTLLKIQEAVKGMTTIVTPKRCEGTHTPLTREEVTRLPKSKQQKGKAQTHHITFTADMFASGVHIFCDGAAVPNPGIGGWGVAIFRDGVEIDSAHGGDPEATNNQMELTAILNAIEKAKEYASQGTPSVTIWCDSQYCVKGCNEWMAGWKAKGWQRGGDKAEPKNRILLNADLWKAIDTALSGADGVTIKWVKGHAAIAGNERADELAEQGRQEVEDKSANLPIDDLDERYRQIMGAT